MSECFAKIKPNLPDETSNLHRESTDFLVRDIQEGRKENVAHQTQVFNNNEESTNTYLTVNITHE